MLELLGTIGASLATDCCMDALKEEIKKFTDFTKHQKVISSSIQEFDSWQVEFVANHDGTIISRDAFKAYIEHHHVLESIASYVFTPIPGQASEDTFIRETKDAIISGIEKNINYKLSFSDTCAIFDYLNKAFSKMKSLPIKNESPEAQSSFYLLCQIYAHLLDMQQQNEKTESTLDDIRSLIQKILNSTKFDQTDKSNIAYTMKQKAAAHCLTKLKAIGLSQETASSIMEHDVISESHYDFFNNLGREQHFLVGEFGSGKSHLLFVWTQILANKNLSRKSDVLPLLTSAREIIRNGSIEDWLAQFSLDDESCFVMIDGLDEISYSDIRHLVEEINFHCICYPKHKILTASRPLSLLADDQCVFVPPLTLDEQRYIFQTINLVEDCSYAFRRSNKNISKMLEKPFFCIIYSEFNAQPIHWATHEMDLVTAFIKKVLVVFDDSSQDLYCDLITLASMSVDRDLCAISKSEFCPKSSFSEIFKTGFVTVQNDEISFSLPIICQWLASEGVRRKTISFSDILNESSRLHRWLYPLSILFSRMTFEESADYFEKIVIKAPSVAVRIIRDGICFKTQEKLPSALECGEKMYYCMTKWIQGLGPLSKWITPLLDDECAPIAINTTCSSLLSYSWIPHASNNTVQVMPVDEILNVCHSRHDRPLPFQPTWPWVVTLDIITDQLKAIIKQHAIHPHGSQLEKEYLWNTACCLSGKGSLWEKPLNPHDYDSYRMIPHISYMHGSKTIDLVEFFDVLDNNILNSAELILPPYPVSDKSFGPGWVWDAYTPEQYLKKAQFVYTSAVNEYLALVNSVFGSIADSLDLFKLSPFKFIGGLEFHEHGTNFSDCPGMTWYVEALPITQNSTVDIRLRKLSISEELDAFIQNNHVSLRSNLPDNSVIWHSQSLNLCNLTPVTNIVYKWLEDDLKKAGWLTN